MSDSLYDVDESNRVLCPALYSRLKELFGRVHVANEGEPILYRTYPRMDGSVHTEVEDGGEYYRVNCFACNDRRQRLWISHMYGQKDANGKRMLFLAHCYNEDCLSRPENWQRLRELVFGFINADMPSQRIDTTFTVQAPEWSDEVERRPEPPGQVVPVVNLWDSQPTHAAVIYLESRQYTPEMCQLWNIGYCAAASPQYSMASGRLIFPLTMNGEFVGWQARYVGDRDWKRDGIPKYYTMRHMRKSKMLYGYDQAKNCPFVVVEEGPTDVHRTGPPAVALLGKTISHHQKAMLLSTWRSRPIFIVLDPEAVEERQTAVTDLAEHNAPVINVSLPDGWDPGKTPHDVLWQIIVQQGLAAGVRL